MLPRLKTIKQHIDKMKSFSDNVILWANMGGELRLTCGGELAKANVYFNKLSHPQMGT